MENNENKTNIEEKVVGGIEVSQQEMHKTTSRESTPMKFHDIFKFLKHEIKRNKILVLVLVLIGLGLLGYRYKSTFIAATVNGTPIFRWEVTKVLEAQGGNQALGMLTEKRLVESEAAINKIIINSSEIDSKIKLIEDSLKSGGQTLDSYLQTNGGTREQLIEMIRYEILVEKLLKDRVSVSDEEVTKYIEDNKETFPDLQDDEQGRSLVKEELQRNKLSEEYSKYISELKARSSINTFVKY